MQRQEVAGRRDPPRYLERDPGREAPIPEPPEILVRKHLFALAAEAGIDEEQLLRLAPGLVAPTTDPILGIWDGTCRKDMMRFAQAWSLKTGLPVQYVEWDAINVGGQNDHFESNPACDEGYLVPLRNHIRRILMFMCTRPNQSFILGRHGGDELYTLIFGVSNLPPQGESKGPRALTMGLDTLVRDVAEWGEEQGLDLVPNPKFKRIFRFRNWGVGLYYGFALLKPEDDVDDVIESAARRVERHKRGLTEGERDPLEISRKKRALMIGMLLCYLFSAPFKAMFAGRSDAKRQE